MTKWKHSTKIGETQHIVVGMRVSLVSNADLDHGICNAYPKNFDLLILAGLARIQEFRPVPKTV